MKISNKVWTQVEAGVVTTTKSSYKGRMTESILRSSIFSNKSSNSLTLDHSEIDITLFVPCYNEEENILATFNEITEAMAELDLTWEIIVIDDASSDNSVLLIKEYMYDHHDYPVTLVVRHANQGLAQNFVDGAFLGRGMYYRLINGDNVESHSQISAILRHIGASDMLIPYHVEVFGRTLFRRYLSKLFTLMVNLITGFRIHYYNGCSVHFRHDVMRWHVNCSGFDFQANLITRLLRQGRTYLEIPVAGHERAFGSSKALTPKNFFSAARFFIDISFNRIWRLFHATY